MVDSFQLNYITFVFIIFIIFINLCICTNHFCFKNIRINVFFLSRMSNMNKHFCTSKLRTNEVKRTRFQPHYNTDVQTGFMASSSFSTNEQDTVQNNDVVH